MENWIALLNLVLAIGAPWACVYTALACWTAEARRGQRTFAAVSAFFLSLPVNAFLGWAWLTTGIPVTLLVVLSAAFCVAVLVARLRRPPRDSAVKPPPADNRHFPIAVVILSGLTALQLALIGVFNFKLGFVAWDAWDSWMLAARTWFQGGEYSALRTFGEWARQGTSTAYSLHHPVAHGPTLSLATVWHAAAIGKWDEGILTLPWWLAYCMLALGAYSALRRLEGGRILASAGAFMTATMPFVMYHAMLAGYADLWVAGLLLCASGWMVLSLDQVRTARTVITILLFATMISLKFPTAYWVLVLTGICLGIRLSMDWLAFSKNSMLLAGVAMLALTVGLLTAVSGIPAESRLDNLSTLLGEAFSGWNWNLGWWILGAGGIASVVMPYRWDRDALTAFCIASLIILFALFSNEVLVESHEVRSTSNRLLLHLSPVMVVAFMLSARDALSGERARAGEGP